ncbi:MAG: EF-hand domain-containing protein [Pseudomonas marincola]
MKRIFIVTGVIAAIALPTAVYATKNADKWGHEGLQEMFEKHDANKDGVMTPDEMPEKWASRFDKLDTDKNGSLTLTEIETSHKMRKEKRMEKMMSKFDTDQDGKVSESEVTAFVLEKFKKMDADGDGSLSMDEIKAMRHMKGFGRGGHDKS